MAFCAGHDVVDRAMDMLDILAELDLDSPACQQAATAVATVVQQPGASLGVLQRGSLLQEGGSGTAGGTDAALEEGAPRPAQRKEDAEAMSALQQRQSVRNPFCRSFALPKSSHGDSVGAEVEHLKQVRLGCPLAPQCRHCCSGCASGCNSTLRFAGCDVRRVDQKHFETSICKAAGPHAANTCAAMI